MNAVFDGCASRQAVLKQTQFRYAAGGSNVAVHLPFLVADTIRSCLQWKHGYAFEAE
jgi:hypothetical protein